MLIHRTPVIIAGKSRGYAKGSVVREAKGFVLLSGAVGQDPVTGEIPKEIGEQTRLAMESIKARLGEYGAPLKNILFVRRYIKGNFPNGIVNDPVYQESDRVVQQFWRENCPELLRGNNPPASTLLGVTSLAMPEMLIEIEVVAALD